MKHKFGLGIFASFLGFFLVLSPVWAAEFMAPDKDSAGNITLSTTETHRNVYVVGGKVLVNSTTQGDLYAAGGDVAVEGTVEQDVVVAGGTLAINSDVGGDVRIFGGTVTINARVGGDVIAGGGTVTISDRASVGGDVVVMGGGVEIHGPVTGYVRAMADDVTVNSRVGGTVTVDAGKRVIFAEKADLASKVTVRAKTEPEVKSGAKVGTIDFTKRDYRDGKKGLAAIITVGLLIKFLAYLIVGLLAAYVWPRKTRTIVEAIRPKMLANMLIGLVTVIVAPILGILLLVTLIGYYAALLVFAAFFLLVLSACIYAFLFLGAWIIQKLSNKPDLRLDWQAALVGVVVYIVLGFVPVVGWIIKAILVLAAIGALLKIVYAHMREERGGVQ